MAKDISKVLSSFKGVKPCGHNSWKALCPCHSDTNASLSITDTPDKILMCCHARCKTEDILTAAGLTFSDLGSSKEKKVFSCFERILYGKQQKYGEGTFIKDHYDYADEYGNYLYTKIRFEGGNFDAGEHKLIRYYRINYAYDSFESGRGDIPKTLYHLPELIRAVKEGYPVYITEGEKDAETLRKFYWTATTAGGVNDWKADYAHYFKGADVRILPDNDAAGNNLAERIAHDLKDYAYKIKIVHTSDAPKGDVTDYLAEEGHNKQTLKGLIDQSPFEYAAWVQFTKNSETINTDILSRVFSRNESYLICRTPDDERDKLYFYAHGVYKRCNQNELKQKIREYIYKGKATKNCLDNVYSLLLSDNDPRHFCRYSDFNADESLINVRNGLFDLKSWKLLPHTPDYLSNCQYNIEYHPEGTDCPYFTKFIDDLCINEYGATDEQKKMQLQEVAGLILSNVSGYRTKKAIFLYSPRGNTGKTQYIGLLIEILGIDIVAGIALSNMIPSNRFALDKLSKCRLVSVGDQTEATVTDSSLFKMLTGGDYVHIEEKNKASYDLLFKGCLLYACNSIPEFKDDKGNHLFERLLIIPCTHTVPDYERDTSIKNKMLKEGSAVFNWALTGLKRLISNKFVFTKSDASEAALRTYRDKVDSVYHFMSEAGYIVTDDRMDIISKSDFYEAYEKWCRDNDINAVQRKNLDTRMEKYGCIFDSKARIGTKAGIAGYRRLKKVYPNMAEAEPVAEDFIQYDIDIEQPVAEWAIPDED